MQIWELKSPWVETCQDLQKQACPIYVEKDNYLGITLKVDNQTPAKRR